MFPSVLAVGKTCWKYSWSVRFCFQSANCERSSLKS